MSGEFEGPLRHVFRRLFPGSLGEEVLKELGAEYRRRRDSRGPRSAWLWYAGHLLHPDTWRLALALRRTGSRYEAAEAVRPGGRGIAAPVSVLDVKIAYRMLVKHPGLTVTAGFAVAFAVALAATSFEFFTDLFYPTLPIDEPHELVEIRTRDIQGGGFETRVTHDFLLWREHLRTVDEIGAFETARRTLRNEDGVGGTLWGASMTGAAFQIARVPPLMGRGLLPSDEAVDAPPVVVISHEVWRSTFEGDPNVVGRTVRLGTEPVTVVGVMPRGFRFPRWHDLWTPLRRSSINLAPGEGPQIQVVARLAPGSSIRAAEAEVAGVDAGTSVDDVERRRYLRSEVVPYGRLSLPQPDAVTAGIYWGCVLFFVMLLVLVFGNVALLLFARTAAREKEITVRSALGASRARIVAQLSVESLLLTGVAAALGLAAAGPGLRVLAEIMRTLQEQAFGYWVGGRISPQTAVWVLSLTVAGAVACGVVPGLKVASRGGSSSRRGLGGGALGPESGRLWSGIIVAQIAATAAFMPPLVVFGIETLDIQNADFGFAAADYLSVRVRTESPAEPAVGFPEAVDELERRLEGVVDAVTAADQVPGGYHDYHRAEVDGAVSTAASGTVHRVQTVRVDPDFFAVLRVPIISGRGFHASDLESGERVIVVNEDFVRVVLGGKSALGRRLRYPGLRDPEADRPEYTIVGVVKQIAMNTDPDRSDSPGVYHLLPRDGAFQLHLIMRTGDAAHFAPRLRALATEVAPTLQLLDVRPVSEAAWDRELAHVAVLWLMLGAGGMAVLLSLSGIHALTSFSVSRRTREIGVRVALGAGSAQVISAILSRTVRRIGIGVAVGGVVGFGILYAFRLAMLGSVPIGLDQAALFGGYLTAMIGVCLLACLVPTARALRIEPTEALKEEG